MPPSSVKNDHAHVSELLPWLINGSLTLEENNRVNAHLSACLECRTQLDFFQTIEQQVQEEPAVWQPSAEHFATLLEAIDKVEAQSAAPKVVIPTKTKSKGKIFSGFFASLTGLRWIAGLEACAIAVLAAVVLHVKTTAPPQIFETLSNSSEQAVLTPSETEIRLLLEDSFTVKDLTALLQKTHAQIRQGPSDLGLFTVAVSKESAADALLSLQKQTGVKWAQAVESK